MYRSNIMLGEQIAEVKGKITGQRVLDVQEDGPKVEYSFSADGKMRDIEITHMATFWTIPRANGILYGEGQGVITTKDGQDMATEIGRGIGQLTDGGKKVRFRGCFFYKTSSTSTGKLSFLNNTVGIFEYVGDNSGNTSYKVWEWM
jgi:hypothetical protein